MQIVPVLLMLLGCKGGESPDDGVRAVVDPQRTEHFFDLPFPSDAQRASTGFPTLDGYPLPETDPARGLIASWVRRVELTASGFGNNTPARARVPDVEEDVRQLLLPGLLLAVGEPSTCNSTIPLVLGGREHRVTLSLLELPTPAMHLALQASRAGQLVVGGSAQRVPQSVLLVVRERLAPAVAQDVFDLDTHVAGDVVHELRRGVARQQQLQAIAQQGPRAVAALDVAGYDAVHDAHVLCVEVGLDGVDAQLAGERPSALLSRFQNRWLHRMRGWGNATAGGLRIDEELRGRQNVR